MQASIPRHILNVYSKSSAYSMVDSTLFTNNRSQAVRLPVEVRFPESVKKVDIRVVGNERIIAPADHAWDSFFLAPQNLPSEDFMTEREQPLHEEREAF